MAKHVRGFEFVLAHDVADSLLAQEVRLRGRAHLPGANFLFFDKSRPHAKSQAYELHLQNELNQDGIQGPPKYIELSLQKVRP